MEERGRDRRRDRGRKGERNRGTVTRRQREGDRVRIIEGRIKGGMEGLILGVKCRQRAAITSLGKIWHIDNTNSSYLL